MSQNSKQIARIKQKVDTRDNWNNSNIVLLDKEIGYERETGKYKIGNGIDIWKNLPYASLEGGNSEANLFAVGEGKNSIQNQNSQANALGDYSLSLGYKTISGIKGYYYSSITFGNEILDDEGNGTGTYGPCVITLTKEQPIDITLAPVPNAFVINYAVGDIISIINNSKYPNCAKIISIENNIVTVDSLPFSTINNVTDPAMDDYSFFCQAKPLNGEVSLGWYANAEGEKSHALERASHAEGRETIAYGQYSHAEGRKTQAGYSAHAEGMNTRAEGQTSHAEGSGSISIGNRTHAEGYKTKAIGENSHAEGSESIAYGTSSHAEGWYTEAEGNHSHSEGYSTTSRGNYSHTEGYLTDTNKEAAHAEGYETKAYGNYSHAEGSGTVALEHSAHAEGRATRAEGLCSHAEGVSTTATGEASHAEGSNTVAYGKNSHTENLNTRADGDQAHAEGYGTQALGNNSHAEGYYTTVSGSHSHVEGMQTYVAGQMSHAEGYKSTVNSGAKYSHAEGYWTIAGSNAQHVEGKYNIVDKAGTYAHVVGGGNADTNRKNIHTLDWNGNSHYAGDVFINVKYDTDGSIKSAKKLVAEEIVTHNMTADGWDGKTYTKINTLYSADDYNVEVFFDGGKGDIFSKMLYDKMELTGSIDDNKLYTYGEFDVEELANTNVPLILKVVTK